ncbi:MAG: 4'-phosphopantetheinyl transferase superfamily protein [Chitinophagales bacterium]|nr:4'-phosphopantetheinyl transferase superfamily protein [Chitinophagales bacterium]MCZ2394833.1 4'-phosphopantetheinyl transferase superfamily protein [Chitinophagales bacterium]
MKVYLLHINQWLERTDIEKYLSQWSDFQSSKILELVQKKDFNASFFGRMLLLYAFKDIGFKVSVENLLYTEKGKPYFSDFPIDFNISHSGEYVALLIAEEECGIDIEQHREINISIFKRQFTDTEFDTINNSSNSVKEFFKFWTIKEAAIKADGRGMAVLSNVQILSSSELMIENNLWYYQPIEDLDLYSFSICGKSSFHLDTRDIQSINSSMLLKLV